jgi:hypothetical protein
MYFYAPFDGGYCQKVTYYTKKYSEACLQRKHKIPIFFRLIQVLELRIIGFPDLQSCQHFPVNTGFWYIQVPFQMCFTRIRKWNTNSRVQAAARDLAIHVIECQRAAKKNFKEFISDILHTGKPGKINFKLGTDGLLGETTRSKVAKT